MYPRAWVRRSGSTSLSNCVAIMLDSMLEACLHHVRAMFAGRFCRLQMCSSSMVPTSVFGCALVCWRVNPKRLSKDFHRSKFCVTKYSISACSWTMFVSTYVRMFEGMFEACSYVRNVRVQQFCKSSCSWKHVRMFAVNMFEGPKSCKMFVSQLRLSYIWTVQSIFRCMLSIYGPCNVWDMSIIWMVLSI